MYVTSVVYTIYLVTMHGEPANVYLLPALAENSAAHQKQKTQSYSKAYVPSTM